MGGGAKICVRCNEDCSTKPRVKDKSGRYMCQACVDASGEEFAGLATSARPARVAAPAAAPVATQEAPIIEGAADVLDLTQERPPAPQASSGGSDDFYSLSPPVERDDITKRPSFRAVAAKAEKRTCSECGYDCTGLEVGKPCPECGATTRKVQRDEKLQAVSDETAREALLRPLYWMIGGLITIAIGLTMWGKGWDAYAVSYLSWIVMVPVSMLAFVIARMMFLTYEEEWKTAVLQLAATMAVVGGVSALLGGTGIGGGLVGGAAMVFMFMYVMDMEKIEAIGMAVILFFVQVGIVIGLAMLIALL